MILLKDCYRALRPGGEAEAGVDVLVDGNRITRIAKGIEASSLPEGTRAIDASRPRRPAGPREHAPSLLPDAHAQSARGPGSQGLFDWLVYLYEIWKGLDADAGLLVEPPSRWPSSSRRAARLSSDHHYLYPKGFAGDLPGIQFGRGPRSSAWRFAPTRGSMSRSKKDGGLPPDTTVQDADTILAACEDAIRKYHDPAPRCHAQARLGSLLALLGIREVDARRGGSRAEARRSAPHPSRRDGGRGRVLQEHVRPPPPQADGGLRLRRPRRLVRARDILQRRGARHARADQDRRGPLPELQHAPGIGHRAGARDARSGRARIARGGRLGLKRLPPTCSARPGRPSSSSASATGPEASPPARPSPSRPRAAPGCSASRRPGGSRRGALADIALFDVMKLEYAGSLSDPVAALLFCGYDHGADYVIVNGASGRGRPAPRRGRRGGDQAERGCRVAAAPPKGGDILVKKVERYARPSSLEAALKLKEEDRGAAWLAGGTFLLAGDGRDKPESVIDVGAFIPGELRLRGRGARRRGGGHLPGAPRVAPNASAPRGGRRRHGQPQHQGQGDP